MSRRSLIPCLGLLTFACGTPAQPPKPRPSDSRVRALADTYLEAYFERYPEQVTYYGVPGRHHDRLTDNSPDALKAWEAREDEWLRQRPLRIRRSVRPAGAIGLRSSESSSPRW